MLCVHIFMIHTFNVTGKHCCENIAFFLSSDHQESPSKHKKIRRVIRDEDLMETTKNATQEEEERRKRVAERQKQVS